MFSRHISSTLVKHFQSSFTRVVPIRSTFLLSQCRTYTRLGVTRSWTCGKFSRWCSQRINSWFRKEGVQLVCTCVKQFELIAAQRIRRSIQIFQLYAKLWDEVAVKEFIKSWRRRTFHRTKKYLLGTIGVTAYNWDKERITDEEMRSYTQEIDEIHKLRDSTVMCMQCRQRLVIDITQIGVSYCNCHGKKQSVAVCKDGESWEPFIEREDMLIWRKQESDSGMYAYKVHGSFSDVSAADFLRVQLDVEYRKEWDNTAKELEIIDTDPLTESSESCRSDIIYWEMMWPRLFANRDYVYQRKWVHNKDKEIVVIASKATDHPKAPNRTDTYRVKSYWSYMVIKPYKDFHAVGIEFGLTYFDDPGVNIPSAVTLWVAMSGLPDYLCRMRQATRDYQKYKANKEKTFTSVLNDELYDSETSNEETSKEQSESNQTEGPQNESTNIKLEPSSSPNKGTNNIDVQEKDRNEEPDPMQEEDKGFLNYFFFTRLFA